MPVPQGAEMINANGVDLCVETFGDPADSPILLIMGSSASMDWWEDEFCERLAAGPGFVIRYDLRDTGQSVTYEPGSPGYTLRDLGDDALALLDNFGLESAHVIAMSMGGAIAQLIALEHPARVASLTLVSTSPATGDHDLPGMPEEAVADFSVPPPDWSDRDAVLDYGTHLMRVSNGSVPFDEDAARDLWGVVFDRTVDLEASMTNHGVIESGEPWRGRLDELAIPTLVIHGTEDPVLPHEHGVALAAEIPNAKLLTIEKNGHGLPRPTWDEAIPAILEHTSEAG